MELRVWQMLAEPEHEELIRLAAATDSGDVAGVARLRKVCGDVEVVRCALMLAEARRKAVGKFGVERAAGLWADPQGVEMATSLGAARHKGGRIEVATRGAIVHDLCCGIGGDSMGMREEGVSVIPVDVDPVRVWMAGMNCGQEGVCADVREAPEVAAAVHIDPARRTASGARSWRMEDLRPGVEVIGGLIAKHRDVAVKLSPGADLEDLPVEWKQGDFEMEYISEDGRMTQAVVWMGAFARVEMRAAGRGRRRATMIVGGRAVFSAANDDGDPPVTPLKRYIAEADDSMERARQLGGLCGLIEGGVLHPRVGLLTADRVLEFPPLTWFEVLAEMPWNERRVKGALEERGAGVVEVKTRGKAVDTDQVQATMRGGGDVPLALFVLRFDRQFRAIIARRCLGSNVR